MKDLSEILSNKDVGKEFLKHPRHKMLDEMFKRVNYDRKQQGYKALPMSFFGVKTSHLSTDDLAFLLKKMQQATYPGKIFFGMLKVKKEEVIPSSVIEK